MSDSVILNHSAVELWFPMDSWGEPKSLVVFSSKFHDIFYVWKLNAEKPKKTTRKIWKLFTDFFRNLQTNKQKNHKFGGTNSKFDVSLRKWNHHSRCPDNRAEEGAEAALQGGQRGLDLKFSFCFFKYIQIKDYIYKSLCIYFNY